MKRLIYKDGGKLIGDYPDDWEPPHDCDMAQGLRNGTMIYVESPPEPPARPIRTLVERIIDDPTELSKLKAALGMR